MYPFAVDNDGLWAVAQMLYETELKADGPRWERADPDTQWKHRERARELCWHYSAHLTVHPTAVTTEVSVGLVDAQGAPYPGCEVCREDAGGYVVDPAGSVQRFACLGHLGVLAAVVMAYVSPPVGSAP